VAARVKEVAMRVQRHRCDVATDACHVTVTGDPEFGCSLLRSVSEATTWQRDGTRQDTAVARQVVACISAYHNYEHVSLRQAPRVF
jgi:hypothetical protein